MDTIFDNPESIKTAFTFPAQEETVSVMLVGGCDEEQRGIRSMFSGAGCEWLTAESGEAALERVSEIEVDVILLDGAISAMSGYDICRQLIEESGVAERVILVLGQRWGHGDRARWFEAGCTDYISQPIEPVELEARLRPHIELARSRRRLRHQAVLLQEVIADQSGRLAQVRSGQENLMADPGDFPELDLAVRFVPAFEAGGDFYDIVRFREGEYGFFVADVAGHDLGTAYLTGALKALTVSFTNETLTGSETMLMMNNALNRFLDPGQYATAFYAMFSRETMIVEMINAGHPAPLVQEEDGNVYGPQMRGDILGIHDVITCDTDRFTVRNGQRLFIFTDGLIEGYLDDKGRPGSRTTGRHRLTEQIKAKKDWNIKETVDSIVEDLLAECSGAIGDDVVLMGLEL